MAGRRRQALPRLGQREHEEAIDQLPYRKKLLPWQTEEDYLANIAEYNLLNKVSELGELI